MFLGGAWLHSESRVEYSLLQRVIGAECNPISPRSLGLIKCRVCAMDQLLRRVASLKACNTDTQPGAECSTDTVMDPLHQLVGFLECPVANSFMKHLQVCLCRDAG